MRHLEVAIAGERYPVPLEFADLDDPDVHVCLDLSGSEWARIHERHGHASRTLSPGSSLLRGGHILLRAPEAAAAVESVEVTIESVSLGGTEQLALQGADARSAEWRDLELVSSETSDGWTRATFKGELTQVSPTEHAAYVERITGPPRPEVEIIGVRMLVDEEEVLSVREHEPFTFEIEIHAAQRVPIADVWIQLTRSDGVYVFWQSTGQWEEGNLRDLEGAAVVRFEFEPNIFGAGDYELDDRRRQRV